MEFGGIKPTVAMESHQANCAQLVSKALQFLQSTDGGISRKPDLISVTRGPGMLSCLAVGLGVAKGLAISYGVPLVGVNHMQAHALTPRLVSALSDSPGEVIQPKFPFLTVLVSGGHTMLVHSKGLTDHEILADTGDIAVGNMLDIVGRAVIPTEVLTESGDIMYARVLEKFVFPDGDIQHEYTAPKKKSDYLEKIESKWGWAISPPLRGSASKDMRYSFGGLESYVKTFADEASQEPEFSIAKRKELGRDAMKAAFEHLASRVSMGLNNMDEGDRGEISNLVVSGGVASNRYLKTILREWLDISGYSHIKLIFPPPALCTDNAAMIAWTGLEMYEAGYSTSLRCPPIRKWAIDPAAEDGGILGVGFWDFRNTK
jgi:N6-L-threonylcarbamoyladenine synthase